MPRKVQTKAQLQRVINQQQKDLAVMASTKEGKQTLIEQQAVRIADLNNMLDKLQGRIEAHEKSYAALLDSYKAEKNVVAATEDRHRALASQLNEVMSDRDNWKRDFMMMQDAHRKMRQNLFEQARLAGVLAMEGKGPFAGYADLSN